MSENLEKARDYVDAYNERDFDRAMEWFDPAVEWILPERQASDSCVGRKPIRRFWEGLDEHFDELRLLPQEWVEAGDRVATRLRHQALGKGSGLALDEELYHQVITFRDGVMVRIEYFAEWEEALAAAHAPAPAEAEGGAGPARAR
ncbi:MAG: nuclear transport factor 2 family protein [Thermoleophilaceae bacterium]|nr:nuclear transport factor 2 family protein [Thermoleophilaceae bacterium]